MPKTKLKVIDDRDPRFKNPLLKVAIVSVDEIRKSEPSWVPVDRLDRLKEYEGYYEVVR